MARPWRRSDLPNPAGGREWGGAFRIPRASGFRKIWLRIIASRGDPEAADEGEKWDHVSVSLADRCPTWDEMEYVKRLFFKADETAFQLHVPGRAHINNDPIACISGGRWIAEIPQPPGELVGLAGFEGDIRPRA